MSDEPRTRRIRLRDVLGGVLVIAMLAVIALVWRIDQRVDELTSARLDRQRQQTIEAIAEALDEAGITLEELAPAMDPKDYPAPVTGRPVPADHGTYTFDPTYGPRPRADIDRLRRPMETAEDYKRMHDDCRRVAGTPTYPVTEWDVFARDMNRSVPTAEEFSAVLRGDRTIWDY